MRREDLTSTQRTVATCVAVVLMILGVMMFPSSEKKTPEKPKPKRTTPILEVEGNDMLDGHRQAVRSARKLSDESRRRTEEWQKAFEKGR